MYDRAYINYLTHFHCERDYFECHEVLEEHWKQDPPKDRKKYWVGFIQLAVALYHHRRGNFNGALKMISNSITIFENERTQIEKLGLHSDEFIMLLKNRKVEILKHHPYTSIDLPILDNSLKNECLRHCSNTEVTWGSQSDLSNEELVHKHMKRNRTDVINERLIQLENRKIKRGSNNKK